MADLDVDVQVLDAGTQALVLHFMEANGYEVVTLGEGLRSFRRTTVESEWVPGRILLNAVLDAQTSSMTVRCGADTQDAMRALINSARDAMGALSYILQVSLGGFTEKWLCEPADSAVGDDTGTYDKFSLMAVKQQIAFTIPRSPILVA